MNFANLLKFEWMKGWRTIVIVAIIAAGVVAEQLLGLDVPGLDFSWEMLLAAVGIQTAAVH